MVVFVVVEVAVVVIRGLEYEIATHGFPFNLQMVAIVDQFAT